MSNKIPKFEVICGSYEEFLLGYYFISKESALVQSFAAHDHSGSVRCVAISDRYLASGASDNHIFIYDLKSRQQHCMLTHHDSTVTCLQFTSNNSHLMSGSLDGTLALVRVGNWQVEKIWGKAHKGSSILDLAIHPTGKLALTLGSDHSLCTWNLIKGRQAYVINLKSKSKNASNLEKILFANDGARFILYGGKYTELWSIQCGGILKYIEHTEKVTSCIWICDQTILVGYESGEVCILDLENDSRVVKKIHSHRVKSLNLYKKWIISVSSNGEVKIFNKSIEEIAVKNTGCRLTSLCVAEPIKIKEEKDVEHVEVEAPIEIKSTVVVAEKSYVTETVEESNFNIKNNKNMKRKFKRNKNISGDLKNEKQGKRSKKKKRINNKLEKLEV